MRILIIDPDGSRQRNLKSILLSLGHRSGEVECCGGAADALGRLKKFGSQCVFCRADFHESTGLDLLGEIRSIPRLKDLPFFLYASGVSKEDVVTASRAGATGIVTYPFTAGDVEEAIRSARQRGTERK